MKAAVTGGAGFIGSYLCEALSNLGRDVTILDNLSSGTRDNLRELIKSKSVKLDCRRLQRPRRYKEGQVLQGLLRATVGYISTSKSVVLILEVVWPAGTCF